MKLVTYLDAETSAVTTRVGALDGEFVVDLSAAHGLMRTGRPPGLRGGPEFPSTLLELLDWEDFGLELAREALAFSAAEGVARSPHAEARMLAPLPRPRSLRDCMLYEQHVRTMMGGEIPEEWFRLPVHWKGSVDSVVGPGDTVPWPSYTERLDFELELGIVIGRRGRPHDASEAAAFIVGYTIFNDWTARDMQAREMSVGLGPSLSKDFATTLGPCLVTADELVPADATARVRVNGELWSEPSVGATVHSFPEAVAHIARAQDLWPGEVIGSGTLGGGCGAELDRWIQPGDVVELEVEGVGTLVNPVGPMRDARA